MPAKLEGAVCTQTLLHTQREPSLPGPDPAALLRPRRPRRGRGQSELRCARDTGRTAKTQREQQMEMSSNF